MDKFLNPSQNEKLILIFILIELSVFKQLYKSCLSESPFEAE